MLFTLPALALAILVALFLARALLRPAAATAPAAAADLAVWRAQLGEVDRDLSRGVLSAADAERARTEISRRILEADRARAAEAGRATTADEARGRSWAALALVALLVAGAFALYARLGAPDYADLPHSERLARAEQVRKTRPSQAEAVSQTPARPAPQADPAHLDLMEKLRAAVAQRPDDLRGHELLARNELALGNFDASITAYRRILEIKGTAAEAQDYAALADAMILQTGGYVSPEAETALAGALDRDPENPTARFYMGLMYAQTLRPDLTFGFWRPLLEDGPQDAPWLPMVRDQIAAVAAAAGIDYRPPAAAMPGPDAAAVAAAGEMSDEERQQMIRGMVEQLENRLATQGGTPEEWARLIGALATLGETDRAKAAWAEAKTKFADRPEALATLDAAAGQAGLAP